MFKYIIPPVLGLLLSAQLWGVAIQEYISNLESSDYGLRQSARLDLWQAFANASVDERIQLEAELILAIDSEHSFAVRDWSIRSLELFGGEASVLPLAQLLIDSDPKIRDLARLALQANPSESATTVLQNALKNGPDEDKPAYLDALAYRGAAGSVEAIAEVLNSSDEMLASKAALALGKLNDDAAIRSLATRHANATGALKRDIELALVSCELSYPSLVSALATQGVTDSVRYAAYEQLVRVDPATASDLLVKADPESRPWMLPVAMQEGRLQSTVTGMLSDLSVNEKVIVLGSIEDLGLAQYESVVWPLLDSDSAVVRDKAIETLSLVGTDRSFPALYEIYQGNRNDQVAKNAMVSLKAPEADAKLLASAKNGTLEEKLSAIELLTLRNSPGALELFNGLAKDSSDTKLQQAAFKSLELIGTPESVQILLNVILEGGPSTRAAQGSLKKLSVSMAKSSTLWREYYEPALRSANEAQKKSILVILDGVSSAPAANYLKGLIQSNNSLRSDALRSLSRWSDVSAGDVWLSLMLSSSATDADVAAAKKGITRVLSQKSVGGSNAAKFNLAVKVVKQSPADFKGEIIGVYEDMKLDHRAKRDFSKIFKALTDDPDVGARVNALL